jgi:hypothetical protein
MDIPRYAPEAIQTLAASRWTLMLAKIFGEKIIGEDRGCVAVMYRWRGKTYLTEFVRS